MNHRAEAESIWVRGKGESCSKEYWKKKKKKSGSLLKPLVILFSLSS